MIFFLKVCLRTFLKASVEGCARITNLPVLVNTQGVRLLSLACCAHP